MKKLTDRQLDRGLAIIIVLITFAGIIVERTTYYSQSRYEARIDACDRRTETMVRMADEVEALGARTVAVITSAQLEQYFRGMMTDDGSIDRASTQRTADLYGGAIGLSEMWEYRKTGGNPEFEALFPEASSQYAKVVACAWEILNKQFNIFDGDLGSQMFESCQSSMLNLSDAMSQAIRRSGTCTLS